jgi:hypothetical protein
MDLDEDLDEVIANAYGLRDTLYEWWIREKSRGVPVLEGGDCKTFFDVFIVFVLVCILLYVMSMLLVGAASAASLIPAATNKIRSLFSSITSVTDIEKSVGDLVSEIVLAKKYVDITALTPMKAGVRLVSSYVTILATNFIEAQAIFKHSGSNKEVGKRVVRVVRAKAFTFLTFAVGSVGGAYGEFSAFLTIMNLVCSVFPSTFWKPKEVEVEVLSKMRSGSDASETSDPRNPERLKLKFPRKRGFVPRLRFLQEQQ